MTLTATLVTLVTTVLESPDHSLHFLYYASILIEWVIFTTGKIEQNNYKTGR